MNKINSWLPKRLTLPKRISENKAVFLFGFGFFCLLSLLILRKILFTHGLIGFEDAVFNPDMNWNRDFHLHIWREFTGNSGIRYILTYPIFLSSYLFSSAEVYSKTLLFFLYVFIGTFSFYVLYLWLKSKSASKIVVYSGALVGAIYFVSTLTTTVYMYDIIGLYCYSLLPVTWYVTYKAFYQNDPSSLRAIKYAIILSLILVISTSMYFMFTLHLIVVALTGIPGVVYQFRNRNTSIRKRFTYTGLLIIATSVMFIANWAYFEVALFADKLSLTEYRHAIISLTEVFQYSAQSQIQNVLRGFGYLAQGYYTTPAGLYTYWFITTLIIPVFVYVTIVQKWRDKSLLPLIFILVAGIFFATGPNQPFSSQYIWLFNHLSPLFVTGGLYYPPRALPLVYLSYAVIAAFAVTRIVNGTLHSKVRKKRAVSIILVILIISGVIVSDFPLYTGNLRNTMNPVDIPQPYKDMNAFLLSDTADYRIAWLPPSDDVFWNPHKESADYWATISLNYLPARLSEQPVTTERGIGNGSSWPQEWDKFEKYVYSLLKTEDTVPVGKLLAMENAKYVIYHADTSQESQFNEIGIYKKLTNSSDLELCFQSEYVSIFKNLEWKPKAQLLGNGTLILGGVDIITTILNAPYFDDNSPFYFVEQNQTSESNLNDFLATCSTILYPEGKDFHDLVLSTIDPSYYLPVLNDWRENPVDSWTKDYFYSPVWNFRSEESWDFDLGLGMRYTDEDNGTLSVQSAVQQGEYEIWIRNSLRPDGGNLEVIVDGEPLSEVNGKSNELNIFKWQKVGDQLLDQGPHQIEIISRDGFNAINTIALVPKEVLKQHEAEVNNSVISNNIREISYLSTDSQPDILLQQVYEPSNTEWAIAAKDPLLQSDNAITLDGYPSISVKGITENNMLSVFTSIPDTDLSTYPYLTIYLFFDSIPKSPFTCSFNIIGRGSWSEWNLDTSRLVEGEWIHYEIPVASPEAKVPYNSPPSPIITVQMSTQAEEQLKFNMVAGSGNYASKYTITSRKNQEKQFYFQIKNINEDGTISVILNNTTYNVVSDNTGLWQHTAPVYFREGTNDVAIESSSIDIATQFVSTVNDMPLTDSNSNSILETQKLNRTEYKYTVDIKEPGIFSFGESTDKWWISRDDQGNVLPKVTLNSLTNGFLVTRTGKYELTVKYGLEIYFTIGKIISCIAVILLLITLFFIIRRESKKKQSLANPPDED